MAYTATDYQFSYIRKDERVFEESDHFPTDTTAAIPVPPAKNKSHRWAIAAFFLGLNALILLIWLAWPSGDAGRSTSASLDTAAPFEETAKPQPVKKPAPPLVVSEDAPANEQEESRVYNQARLKLQSANRWKMTHPEKARGFAREAIKLAPDTDVAAEAKELLDSLH